MARTVRFLMSLHPGSNSFDKPKPSSIELLQKANAGLHMQDGKGAMLQDTKEASTGVYVGCVWQEYQVLLDHLQCHSPLWPLLTGSGMNFMVGRVSYTFGLAG